MPEPRSSQIAAGVWAVSSERPAGGDPAKFYAIESAGGFTLIDAGWRSDQAREALAQVLDEAGGGLDDVSGVVLTHLHPDHSGLAGELRERTGAWIASSAREAAAARHRHGPDAPLLEQLEVFLGWAGVPNEEAATMLAGRREFGRTGPILELDRIVVDGDRLELGERTLVALSTPGHSPGHLCFEDRENGLLFAGDMILPKRNPPVGAYTIDGHDDPVSDFFASLDRLAQLDGCLVLPGHGDPFKGPARDAERLRSHHEKRMLALTRHLAAGPSTVWEAAVAAPWSSRWQDLSPMAKLLGVGKVNAHLTALAHRGLVERVDGDPARHALVAARADGRAELASA